MAIKRFDPENVKSSYMSSGAGPIYRDTMPPFRLESDYGGERSYAEKMRILAHDRRADPLTGELRTGGYPIDFSTASGWEEGPMGIDPSRIDDMDYVRRKSDEYDRLAYGRDAFESAYRTPSVERRMDPYTGEMVDMSVGLRSGDGKMWSRGKLLEPTTEEEYYAMMPESGYYYG